MNQCTKKAAKMYTHLDEYDRTRIETFLSIGRYYTG